VVNVVVLLEAQIKIVHGRITGRKLLLVGELMYWQMSSLYSPSLGILRWVEIRRLLFVWATPPIAVFGFPVMDCVRMSPLMEIHQRFLKPVHS
jgi:hypothetical protein